MKQRIALACLLTMPMLALSASAASSRVAAPDLDLSGTWTISGDVQGVAVDETCTVTQQDVALTGSCNTSTGKYDLKGKLDGRTATFTHGGKYQGSDLVITFTGKVAQDGTMAGTMDVDPFNATGSFSAKKGDAAKPATPAN